MPQKLDFVNLLHQSLPSFYSVGCPTPQLFAFVPYTFCSSSSTMVWFGMNFYLGSICLSRENWSLIMIGPYNYLLTPMFDAFRSCCDLMFKVIQIIRCANWHINTYYQITGHLHRGYYNRKNYMVQRNYSVCK